jgi:hypothetical protein
MTAFHTIAIPHDDMEKKLMDGFLTERDRFQQRVENFTEQGELL